MAGTSEYFGEAYEALQRLSADERKRLEYEQRDKALKDYNSQMDSGRSRINNGLSLLFVSIIFPPVPCKRLEVLSAKNGGFILKYEI